MTMRAMTTTMTTTRMARRRRLVPAMTSAPVPLLAPMLLLLALLPAPNASADSIVYRETQSLDLATLDISVKLDFTRPFDPEAGDGFGYYFGSRRFPEVLERHGLRLGTESAFPGMLVFRPADAYLPPFRGSVGGIVPYVLSPDGLSLSFTVPGFYEGPPILLPPRAIYTLVTFEKGVPSEVLRGEWGIGVPIPEPGTLGMCGVGVVLVGAFCGGRAFGGRRSG